MKAPSTALLRTFSPLWRTEASHIARGCLSQQQQQRADFSSTPAPQAKKGRNKIDSRISMATIFYEHVRDGTGSANYRQLKSDTISNIPKLPDPYASPGTQTHPSLPIASYPTNKIPSNRALRHWTIHRAWQLYQYKSRLAHTKSLEKQYQSMASACEALRLIDNQGLTAEERERLGARSSETEGEQTGKLYRLAMMKKGIWDGVPIEYARIQTDTPSREGWNHGWTR